MIVSFDLDDTLFVSPPEFQTENELTFPWKKIYKERLRLGTIELFRKLQSEGIETWIYTTSFRTEKYIRHLFGHYGIKVGQIINGSRHMKEVQALHIDDDPSVMQNGKVYGFRVFLVGPPDDEWGDKILQEAMRIKCIMNK